MSAYGSIDVLRDADRFVTERDGITTRHLLSFGGHYEPARTSIGPLIAHNDERLAAGHGYPSHRHSGVEIVTWVVSGRLLHSDGAGGRTVLEAGSVQVLSAGSGVVHEERAADVPTRFIQMWLTLDAADAVPVHAAATAYDDLRSRLVPVARGGADAAGKVP